MCTQTDVRSGGGAETLLLLRFDPTGHTVVECAESRHVGRERSVCVCVPVIHGGELFSGVAGRLSLTWVLCTASADAHAKLLPSSGSDHALNAARQAVPQLNLSHNVSMQQARRAQQPAL